jgi:transposase
VDDATSVLFDLPGFIVIECVELDEDRRVVIMQVAVEHGCPRCGVLVGGKPYDVRESPIKDLPFGERPLVVIWRKRRYRCLEPCGAARMGCGALRHRQRIRRRAPGVRRQPGHRQQHATEARQRGTRSTGEVLAPTSGRRCRNREGDRGSDPRPAQARLRRGATQIWDRDHL